MFKNLTIAVITLFVVLHGFGRFANSSDKRIAAYFDEQDVAFAIKRTDYNGTKIRYVETGLQSDTCDLILFVHGAPGTWDAFKGYLADVTLRHSTRLLSIDRLGYGGSARGDSEPSIIEQAKAINHVLSLYPSKRIFLVGHSYGCAIAAKAAMTNSSIDAVMMVAPLLDPNAEPVKWYAHLANLPVIKQIIPSFIRVATNEKMGHADALRAIENDWANVTFPILHYHGDQDKLAPYEANVTFAKERIPDQYLSLTVETNAGHILIWTQVERMRALIGKMKE